MFASSTRYIRSLIHKLPKRNFSLLDPEYYNKVYQENIDRDTMKLRKVSLRGKRKETYDIEIYGVPVDPLPAPEGEINQDLKELFASPAQGPIFLQIDPTKYLYASRQVAAKIDDPLANKNEELLRLLERDPIHPYSWEEAVANIDVISRYAGRSIKSAEEGQQYENFLEKLSKNKAEDKDKIDISKAIFDVVFDNNPSPYYDLNNIAIYSLLLNSTTVLGGFPKLLKRMAIGNSLPLSGVRDMFASCCDEHAKVRKTQPNISLADIATVGYPEIFYASENIYMILFLKELALQNGSNVKAFVGIDYVDPIADNWESDELLTVSFAEVLGIPARVETDTADALLEKHAILDVLLEENAWNSPYLKNPFPYLTDEENNDSTILDLKKKYFVYYKKYSAIKEKLESS